jgi:hypothetical protein
MEDIAWTAPRQVVWTLTVSARTQAPDFHALAAVIQNSSYPTPIPGQQAPPPGPPLGTSSACWSYMAGRPRLQAPDDQLPAAHLPPSTHLLTTSQQSSKCTPLLWSSRGPARPNRRRSMEGDPFSGSPQRRTAGVKAAINRCLRPFSARALLPPPARCQSIARVSLISWTPCEWFRLNSE